MEKFRFPRILEAIAKAMMQDEEEKQWKEDKEKTDALLREAGV